MSKTVIVVTDPFGDMEIFDNLKKACELREKEIGKYNTIKRYKFPIKRGDYVIEKLGINK